MTPKPSAEERARRGAQRLAAAEAEAASLREIVQLTEVEGRTYAEAMEQADYALPHSTLHDRLERLKEGGAKGLVDGRHPPPSPVTPEIRGFIEGIGRSDPVRPVEEILGLVLAHFKVTLKLRTVQDVLHQAGLARPPHRFTAQVQPASKNEASEVPTEEMLGTGAGLIWLTVGDDLVGYTKGLADAVHEVTKDFPPASPVTPEERSLRDEKGQFLPEYNAPRERKDPEIGAVFESVETKREDKDLGRLRINGSREETLRAKLLTLMALPMVTNAGHFDGATDVRGTWLIGLGLGIDYQPETLAKVARELKWAGASGAVLERHAQIWYEQAASWIGEGACCSVLYVDCHTKALWTEHFHKSGRVAMLGRVMPCFDTVTINQGAGVPLWIRTFSGHVALVKNVLPLIGECEDAIGKGMLGRLTVIDGEMDCVALFKEFDLAGRYFITPLDSSRVKDLSSIEGLRHLDPYRDGDWIGGGRLELKDSSDREAPPYRTRVVVLQRRTKESVTAFATNAPAEQFPNAVLLDVFFGRWPKQEHVFRQLNAAAAFKSVHGYGKQRVLNVTVIDSITQLDAQVERLDVRRQKGQERVAQTATTLHQREVDLKRTKRTLDSAEKARHSLREQGKTHTAAYARQGERKAIAKGHLENQKLKASEARRRHRDSQDKLKAVDNKIADKKTEKARLESRREILQTDVELDQGLSVLKAGFVLILQFLLRTFFNNLKMDPVTFANQILLLPGVRLTTDTTVTIRFQAHRRNPEMMEALEKACEIFNSMRHTRDGRLLRFEVSWPPGTRRHAA